MGQTQAKNRHVSFGMSRLARAALSFSAKFEPPRGKRLEIESSWGELPRNRNNVAEECMLAGLWWNRIRRRCSARSCRMRRGGRCVTHCRTSPRSIGLRSSQPPPPPRQPWPSRMSVPSPVKSPTEAPRTDSRCTSHCASAFCRTQTYSYPVSTSCEFERFRVFRREP